eukprot:Hpha_TRINITY_DN16696_c2_g2::TRINITY_DN16696_c2_g2_i10::g.179589::m.179589
MGRVGDRWLGGRWVVQAVPLFLQKSGVLTKDKTDGGSGGSGGFRQTSAQLDLPAAAGGLEPGAEGAYWGVCCEHCGRLKSQMLVIAVSSALQLPVSTPGAMSQQGPLPGGGTTGGQMSA